MAVEALESEKRRGRRALIAGVLMILIMSSVWIWVDRLFAGNSGALADASTGRLLGRLNVAFAMVVISAVLGIINGSLMVRTGRRNKPLIWATVIVFVAGFFTAYGA